MSDDEVQTFEPETNHQEEEQVVVEDGQDVEDLGEDISKEQNGGLYKKIIREGHGATAPEGSEVIVHYVGKLLDGTVFDSSRDRNEHFTFKLGERMIKGWDTGVKTMKKGELAMLTCSPEYGYGEKGSPPNIPGDATLKFEVEVIGWKGENVTDDGGVTKVKLKKGEGLQSPNDKAEMTIHVIGRYDDRVFEDREVMFKLGEGEDYGIVEGVELALEKMKKEEKAEITVKPQYAYGEKGSEEHNIPPNTTVQYTVELIEFTKAREVWAMDAAEKVETAKSAKEQGTGYFKNGKYSRALKEYKRILTVLENAGEGESEEVKPLQTIGHLNKAACFLKLSEHYEAAKACEEALKLDENNVKGYFRRGQAHMGMEDFEDAKRDFLEVLKREPRNKAAREQIAVANKQIQQMKMKERKIYSNMFEKLAAQDEKEGGQDTNDENEQQETPPTNGQATDEDSKQEQEVDVEKKDGDKKVEELET